MTLIEALIPSTSQPPPDYPPPPSDTIHLAMCQQMTRTVLRLAAGKIRTWQTVAPPQTQWQPGTKASVRALIEHHGQEVVRFTKNRKGKITLTWRADAGEAYYDLLHDPWPREEDHNHFHKVRAPENPPAPSDKLTLNERQLAQLVRTMAEGLLQEQATLTALEYHTKDEVKRSEQRDMQGYTWYKELVTILILETLCNPEDLHQAQEWQLDFELDMCHCQTGIGNRWSPCLCFCEQCIDIGARQRGRLLPANLPKEAHHYRDDWGEAPDDDEDEINGLATRQEGRNHRAFGNCPPPAPYLTNWQHQPAQDQQDKCAAFDLTLAHSQINQITADTLIDPEVITLTTALTQTVHPDNVRDVPKSSSTKAYNRVLRHKQAYAELIKTAPGLAAMYYWQSPNMRAPKHSLTKAGQMVSQLKRATKLKGQAWTILHRLTSTSHSHLASAFNNPNQAGRISKLLADANRPQADDRFLETAATAIDWDRVSRSGNAATKARHRDNFRRMLSAYLGPGPGDRSSTNLMYVSDAVYGISMDGQHWGNSTWEQMTRRATRWHDEQAEKSLNASGKHLHWHTPLQRTEIAGYTLTPLTNSAQVNAVAARMRNCLNIYTPSLNRGTRQVFLLENGTEPTAAVMLAQKDGQWRITEAEAARRGKLSKTQCEAAKAGLALYNAKMETQT